VYRDPENVSDGLGWLEADPHKKQSRLEDSFSEDENELIKDFKTKSTFNTAEKVDILDLGQEPSTSPPAHL
jgi:hypothetical protein